MIDALGLAMSLLQCKGSSDVRSIAFLAAMTVAGCASQPHSASTQPSAAPNPTSAQIAPAQLPGGGGLSPSVLQAVNSSPDVEAQRLARAKNLNLKIMNKDGKEMYCRSNFVTASRIQRDTTCYTAEQVEQMQDQTTRFLDNFNQRPSAPPKLLQ
jgi:hypothetical protein